MFLGWDTARSTSRKREENDLEEEGESDFNECTEMKKSRMTGELLIEAGKMLS